MDTDIGEFLKSVYVLSKEITVIYDIRFGIPLDKAYIHSHYRSQIKVSEKVHDIRHFISITPNFENGFFIIDLIDEEDENQRTVVRYDREKHTFITSGFNPLQTIPHLLSTFNNYFVHCEHPYYPLVRYDVCTLPQKPRKLVFEADEFTESKDSDEERRPSIYERVRIQELHRRQQEEQEDEEEEIFTHRIVPRARVELEDDDVPHVFRNHQMQIERHRKFMELREKMREEKQELQKIYDEVMQGEKYDLGPVPPKESREDNLQVNEIVFDSSLLVWKSETPPVEDTTDVVPLTWEDKPDDELPEWITTMEFPQIETPPEMTDNSDIDEPPPHEVNEEIERFFKKNEADKLTKTLRQN